MCKSPIRCDFRLEPFASTVSFITDAPTDVSATNPPRLKLAHPALKRRVADLARDAQLIAAGEENPASSKIGATLSSSVSPRSVT